MEKAGCTVTHISKKKIYGNFVHYLIYKVVYDLNNDKLLINQSNKQQSARVMEADAFLQDL